MATIDFSNAEQIIGRPPRTAWWRRVVLTAQRHIRTAAAERTIRGQIRELESIEGWILADMGLTRGAIECAIRESKLGRATA